MLNHKPYRKSVETHLKYINQDDLKHEVCFHIILYTVNPVLRGHLWDTEKVAL